MHSHLVAIEVGVECRTCQRMQLNGLTFYHFRLERLNTQAVQRWCTVQQHRMTLHHIFQNIPNNRIFAVDDFFGRFYGFDNTAFYQLTDNERFIQFGSHIFRQTAFAHFQFGANDDNRACRIVNTFTQQVLTETTLFTFQAIRQRFQRTVRVALHSRRLTRVVYQAVNGFLQHTFFVAQNNFRSLDFDQAFQAVVANDNTAIQIVQIRCSKAAAVQRYQRAQFGRNHRNDFQNHPFRTVFRACSTERFHHLQTFQRFGLALLRRIGIGFVAQLIRQRVQIEAAEQIVNGFGAHFGDEFIGVRVVQKGVIARQTIQ